MESIGDDKGIDLSGLLLVGVGPFEIADDLGGELIKEGMKGGHCKIEGEGVD